MIQSEWLKALETTEEMAATPANLSRMARTFGEEAARWAVTQWDLRRRANAKFARAREMLFVREALEQATHEQVAAYHARQFPVGAPVADLTTGIGSDLIALAARGPTTGFELDESRLALAGFNLSVHGLEADLTLGDGVAGLSDANVEYAFADPSRRIDGQRTNRLDEFSPDPRDLSARFASLRLGILKLTPMLSDSELEALGPRLEFISFGGECREVLVYQGQEAIPGRFAVQVDSNAIIEDKGEFVSGIEAPDALIFDADPAAVRSHALSGLALGHGLRAIGDSPGYLTGPEVVISPWLRPYRVLHVGKADVKTTRAALRQLNAATPELKQRGAGLDLIAERKRYLCDGSRPVSLIIWKQGKSLRHAITESVPLT